MNAIIDGLPEAEYRAVPGLSGTEVAKILDNPADLKWRRDHPTPSTAAQSLGTLVHALVLTPGVPLPFALNPYSYQYDRKKWQARQDLIILSGQTKVDKNTWDGAHRMAEAVMANPEARRLLEAPGYSEVTFTGEHNGAPLKGRIDRLPNVGPVIDLKTARDVSPAGMARFIGDYGTVTQLAHYALLADRLEQPIIIAVRNQDRPAVAVYRIADMTWQIALDATRRAWDLYADCHNTGNWPDTYADEIRDLELKPWAMDELDGGPITNVEVTL